MSSSVFILGTRIDNYTMDEAIERVEHLLAQGGSHYVVTPNPEILLRAYRSPALQSILNGASLSLCDGTGAYLAAWCIGRRIKGRVPGVDFMEALGSYSASHGLTIALIGGQEKVREKVRELFQHRHAGITIFSAEGNPDESVKADIALVAFGSPKQEQWMAREKASARFKIMVGVGGAFDMLSGELVRAPRMMRRIGCEWLWRFLLEPQRAARIGSAVILFPYSILRFHWFQ